MVPQYVILSSLQMVAQPKSPNLHCPFVKINVPRTSLYFPVLCLCEQLRSGEELILPCKELELSMLLIFLHIFLFS